MFFNFCLHPLYFFSILYIIFIQINYLSFANFTLISGNLQLKRKDFIRNIFNCLNE
jgi:hypothetical protein